MSNPFVPLMAGLIRVYERIPRRGDFVRYFVTHPSRHLFRHGFVVDTEKFLPLPDFVGIKIRR